MNSSVEMRPMTLCQNLRWRQALTRRVPPYWRLAARGRQTLDSPPSAQISVIAKLDVSSLDWVTHSKLPVLP